MNSLVVDAAKSIDALRLLAERRLPKFVFEFLERGAEDEWSLDRNREAFSEYAFVPRTLIDVSSLKQTTTLFGRSLSAPVVVAPTGRNGMLSRHADLSLAKAAALEGVPFTLSTPAMFPIEDLAKQVDGDLWFQLYLSAGTSHDDDLIRRVDSAGYRVLVITVDTPVSGNREWRYNTAGAGSLVKKGISLQQWIDGLSHPDWFADVVFRHGWPRYAHLHPAKSTSDVESRQRVGSLQWDDIRRLREKWPRTLVIKGILSAKDAELAHQYGADGIVLSNHGGRQLDGAISPLDALPDVVRAVGSKLKILIDGGFRRGSDIAKALALGADAVLLGRAMLYGVAAGGEAGATRALRILLSELDRVQALLGCRDLSELDQQYLQRVGR